MSKEQVIEIDEAAEKALIEKMTEGVTPVIEKTVTSSKDDIIQSLIARIEALEAAVQGLTGGKPKPKAKTATVCEVSFDDEEEELRPKRLLRK